MQGDFKIMELKELEQKKAELIETVECWTFRGEEGQAMQALIIKLLKGTECTDPDFAQALEDGTAESIISLDLDCYSLAEFVKWLANHNFDLFIDYRFAETKDLADAIQEIEEEQYAPSYCYNFDFEEFKELADDIEKGDYIKDHFDGLLYSNNTLVISW